MAGEVLRRLIPWTEQPPPTVTRTIWRVLPEPGLTELSLMNPPDPTTWASEAVAWALQDEYRRLKSRNLAWPAHFTVSACERELAGAARQVALGRHAQRQGEIVPSQAPDSPHKLKAGPVGAAFASLESPFDPLLELWLSGYGFIDMAPDGPVLLAADMVEAQAPIARVAAAVAEAMQPLSTKRVTTKAVMAARDTVAKAVARVLPEVPDDALQPFVEFFSGWRVAPTLVRPLYTLLARCRAWDALAPALNEFLASPRPFG
jgi:hypothetical protein